MTKLRATRAQVIAAAVIAALAIVVGVVGLYGLNARNSESGAQVLENMRLQAILNTAGSGAVDAYVAAAKSEASTKARESGGGMSAVREAAAVAAHLHEAGKAWGIDGDRLAFAGDSGGAHLGLAATLYLREEMGGADFVKCLLLFYGWFGLTDSSSMRLLGGPWDGLTEEDWQFYLNLYAEDPAALAAEPYANLFLNDLTHDVPACYIAAAEFDPLRDDSATLAAICEQYGTPFRFELFEGVIHAFLHYTKMLDAANDVLEHGATFYRETLGLA